MSWFPLLYCASNHIAYSHFNSLISALLTMSASASATTAVVKPATLDEVLHLAGRVAATLNIPVHEDEEVAVAELALEKLLVSRWVAFND